MPRRPLAVLATTTALVLTAAACSNTPAAPSGQGSSGGGGGTVTFASVGSDKAGAEALGKAFTAKTGTQVTVTITDVDNYQTTLRTQLTSGTAPDVFFTWGGDGNPARHDLSLKDVRVRNVPTNIRDWGGGTERHGNSIFVFEVANLCIAHLGHLHHTLTQAQLDELGRIDVVLMPVDGSYTLDIEGMTEVLKALKAPLMIPMHYFSSYTLGRFLDRVRGTFETEVNATPSLLLSKTTLPTTPKVLVLPGG